MRLDKLLHAVRLKTKIIGVITFAIVLTTIVGSGFFYARTRTMVFDNLQRRGRTICKDLSYSAKYGVLTEDIVVLNELAEGVMRNEDVVYVVIQNDRGKTLAERRIVELPDLSKMASLKKKALLARRSEISSIEDELGTAIYNFSYPIIAKKVSLADMGAVVPELEDQPSEQPQLRGAVQVGLSLSSALSRLRNVLHWIIALTFIIIVCGVIASLALARIIMKPIKEMADVAKIISEKNQYSIRAAKYSNDEVGLFTDAFNHMLEQVQQRDLASVQAKEQLEIRVQKRTAELSSTNVRLRKAEQKQSQLLRKVKKINRELKDFAYITSHDLKAPLRGISTLAEWISSDYGDKLGENGREQLNLLLNRVTRMHNLIDGVLQYSRVGRAEEEQAQVNLNELMPEIIDTVAPPQNIEITIEDPLPVIQCQKTRITQLFQNLLSNAVKYMDKPQGKIRIGCIEENGFWKFSIADNGPGIEERHFEKIFKIFQTLSSWDKFESTGVGLAVVKKIVQLYEGQIWVQSKPGEGSIFFFTLPKKKMEVKNAELETNIVS